MEPLGNVVPPAEPASLKLAPPDLGSDEQTLAILSVNSCKAWSEYVSIGHGVVKFTFTHAK